MEITDYIPAAFAGHIGVAVRDITPPAGIYARNWGAAKHDRAEGVHQPLLLQAVTFQAARDADPLVLMAMDVICFFSGPAARYASDEWTLRKPVLDALGLEESRLLMACSHSHATPSVSSGRKDEPGGDLIEGYRAHIARQAIDAAREALRSAAPSTLTWATGRCSLAANRDLFDPQRDRYVTGTDFSQKQVDDTVLVGRITRDSDSRIIATLVNYACHPTTLAWQNKLISPDYVGSMRDLVQAHTGGTSGAPCLFLQGSSGEQGPVEGFTGDLSIAERNGRQLGYAALEALESMLPPRTKLVYGGVMESGAPLALWNREPFDPPTDMLAVMCDVTMPLKADRPTEQQLLERIRTGDRVMVERAKRALSLAEALGSGNSCKMPMWCWRLGRTLIAAQPSEAYTAWTRALRSAFPQHAVAALNVTNTSMCLGYICPDPILQRTTLYQAWQTPFGPGSHDSLVRTSIERLNAMVSYSESSP